MNRSPGPSLLCVALLAASLSATAPARSWAQELPDPASEPTRIEDIVVTARRAEVPIWTVSKDDVTVILAGSISGVPRDLNWRPEALEAATARSQRILYPTEGRASLSDIFRLIWRIRTIASLPEGKSTADYLSPEWQIRLEAVMAGERNEDWRSQSLVGLGFDLMEKAGRERRSRGAVEAVRRAARSAKIEGAPIGFVRGDELVDGLITDSPETYVACIEAAIGAAEAGPDGAANRLSDWRQRLVPDVLDSALDQALNLCWPSGDPEIAPELRRQWTVAITEALTQSGVTMGVAPLRILAEPGGVLDQLQAQGLEIDGPEWK